MAVRGRPTKLTTELADEFCKHIANGLSIHRTSQLMRLDKNTVGRWLKSARQFQSTGKPAKNRVFADFAEKIAASEAQFIANNVKSVQKAATPRTSKVIKRTVRNTYDLAGNQTGTSEVIEETTKRELDWAAAKWLLECKDRESFGPDRHEIAALKKEMAELQKVLAKALDRIGGKAEEPEKVVGPVNRPAEQAVDRAGAVDEKSVDPNPGVGVVGSDSPPAE